MELTVAEISAPSAQIARQYGCKVADHQDVQQTVFEEQVGLIEIVSFVEPNDFYIHGKAMRLRAVGLRANLGLLDAKCLLDHQEKITEDFRKRRLVFTGTLMRGPDNALSFAYLFYDRSWQLKVQWLDWNWCGNYYLVRNRNNSVSDR
ncbi:MAG: hypothetical protein G01um101413_623 [Parcubacteria group bacterium Gr01-1014_13]|nr:MAG: hypothetical protein G01um101413_623 [Parcubacteria group bacterium Gr01-1014_13]